MDFEQVEKKFKQLKAEFDAGKLPESEFKSQLEDLMIQDKQGSWWMIGYETGLWYRNDGKEWVQTDPPDRSPKKSTSVVPTAPKPKAQKQTSSVSKKLGSTQVRLFGFIGIIVVIAVATFLFRPKNQETANLSEKAMSTATASTLGVQQPSVVKPTSTSTSTTTPRPTWTPKPTKTPNLAATQAYEDLYTQVQDYYDAGYISSMDGSYQELDDFNEEWAQLGWYQWWSFDTILLKEFVISAHFSWSTASDTPEDSGCGIIFAINGSSHHYGMFLDKSRILFTRGDESYWYEVGKTRGTGRVSFGNPAEADVSMTVSDYKANVIVNGEFIGQYTLSKDKPIEGNLGYSLLSGTNKDYGTRCEITNARLWTIQP